jgi:hypothetical protein
MKKIKLRSVIFWITLFNFSGCATVFNNSPKYKGKSYSESKSFNGLKFVVEMGAANGGTWYSISEEENRKKLIVEMKNKLNDHYCVDMNACKNSNFTANFKYDISVVDSCEDCALISVVSLYLIPNIRKLKLKLITTVKDKNDHIVYENELNEVRKVYFYLFLIPFAFFNSPPDQFKEIFSELTDTSINQMEEKLSREM